MSNDVNSSNKTRLKHRINLKIFIIETYTIEDTTT